MNNHWSNYNFGDFYDELMESPMKPRKEVEGLITYFSSLDEAALKKRRETAELTIKLMGITFTVYTEGTEKGNIDRIWPFDIIPRVISSTEWERTERGLKQRLIALNLFINDIYNEQKIIKDGVFPKEILAESKNFRQQCVGIKPKYGVWAHICGSDLVRDKDGTLYVLEDNLRVPSGVSYMLQNRIVTKRVFPEVFDQYNIRPVDNYTLQLFDTLASLSPRSSERPNIVVMTPGIYNSAYFEHSFLAQQMGAELVEGSDLVVNDDCVYVRTIYGLKRVDVIYRRVDDLFLDPEVFYRESALGVPGVMRAWQKGNVALANAPGAGVADDKVVYAFVPKMIKYYLGEDAIIPNVPTYLCTDEKERSHVLANLDKLVVKPANESGGYGMLIGPHATPEERNKFIELINKNPRNYIAQPTLSLSTAPTLCDGVIEPRHLDLRPFTLHSAEIQVTSGGLTRVAMRKGSLVVNSSQGGGSKDTWIIDNEEA